MKKHKSKIVSLLILIILLMGISSTIVANAQMPFYVMPYSSYFEPGNEAYKIETIVNQKSIIDVTAENNKVEIDGNVVANEHNEAVEEMNEYITQINNNGMDLNREPINTVTVQIRDVNFSEFAEVMIDKENLALIAEVNILKIVFRNKNEYIILDKENIGYLISCNKGIRIQFKEQSGAYVLRFMDPYDAIIPKFDMDIKLALPAKNGEQTVYLYAENTQVNWGGIYNSATGAIEVMTKYSGEYNVALPDIAINDISGLTEEENQAIRLMVARGYFKLNEGNFDPFDNLTRYDFAETLVRMFYVTDSESECGFADVDKEHKEYIAALQKMNVIFGHDDSKFRGNDNITVEQAVVLIARTLNHKKGYLYPENISKYLNVTEENPIGEATRKEVALAIREGIYSNSANLIFADDITRKDAAVLLYRLYVIMNNAPEKTEVPETEYDYSGVAEYRSFWNRTNAIIIVSGIVLIVLNTLMLSLVFIGKKRKDE